MSRRVPVIVILSGVFASTAFSAETIESIPPPDSAEVQGNSLPFDEAHEPYNTGWILNFDNDLFVPNSAEDADYTGGLAITLTGRRVTEYGLSLHPLLLRIDRMLGIDTLYEGRSRGQYHAMQFGAIAFSPGDLTARAPIPDDRPYAELLFLSNARLSLHESGRIAYRSTFTVGILGLGVVPLVQDALHGLTGSEDPNGYNQQISDGGEPTIRYAVSRHALLAAGFSDRGRRHEITFSTGASVGYLTEGSAAISVRWGRISSPWWSFTPDLTDYMARPILAPRRVLGRAAREFYFWGGVMVRARLYNSFLQGQSRESPVTFSFDELNPVIGEAWLGVTRTFGNDLVLGDAVRYQTREIRHGTGARGFQWGSLTLSKSF
jgi:hypothetical protein